MTISEHDEVFAGRPIREYDPEDGIKDPLGTAPRLSIDYDASNEGQTFAALLSRFLDDPASRQVGALVVGTWDGLLDGGSDSSEVVKALVDARDRLTGLKAIFLGDITYDEYEISWIQQCDVTPILEAYPELEEFRVRGGSGLKLKEGIKHGALRSLIIESGGLDGAVVRAVASAKLPKLEHLELWLGTSEYGGDSTVDDLAPILDGKAFPALKRLGLRDAEDADGVAVALAEAPIMRTIEQLDLSLGSLGDEGVLALLSSGVLRNLKRLDIHHHYVSDEVLDGLIALGLELDASDRQGPDSDRYVSVSE